MNKLLFTLSMLAVLSACDENKPIAEKNNALTSSEKQEAPVISPQPTHVDTEINTEAEIAQARAVIKVFAGTLKNELQAGMQNGGPVNALAVCNTKAPQIAEKVATEEGVQVSRVSLKNRNADNAPNDWQQAVLEDFETRKAEGADPATLEFSEVVTIQDRQEFRFMKAIPTGGVCLACHGEDITKDVQETITELYPADKATNFQLGDIRGSFVVTKMIN